MIRFTISGTLPGLNAYITAERTNRFLGAKLKRQCEIIVQQSLKKLGKTKAKTPVFIEYRWFEPNRRRDKDNISSFERKVIQDALVRAKVLQNDGWEQIAGFADRFFVVKINPRIEVRIYEAEQLS